MMREHQVALPARPASRGRPGRRRKPTGACGRRAAAGRRRPLSNASTRRWRRARSMPTTPGRRSRRPGSSAPARTQGAPPWAAPPPPRRRGHGAASAAGRSLTARARRAARPAGASSAPDPSPTLAHRMLCSAVQAAAQCQVAVSLPPHNMPTKWSWRMRQVRPAGPLGKGLPGRVAAGVCAVGDPSRCGARTKQLLPPARSWL